MPIHEFSCPECGAVNEFLVGMGRNSDDQKCRVCGGTSLERIMSVSAISVKEEVSPAASTCCGSNPSQTGCTPGSCCGEG